MEEKYLGKIQSIEVGFGGYQDAMLGLTIDLVSSNCGISDFKGTWNSSVKVSENTKWTEADRSRLNDETMRFIDKLLTDAKVHSVSQLRNKPVEFIINNNTLKSWRILKEVL